MFSCDDAGEIASPKAHVGCACCSSALRSISIRIDRDMSRRGFIAGMGASLSALGFSPRAAAQAANSLRPVVFSNFLLFDGKASALRGGLRLIVEEGRIKALGTKELSPPDGATVIDCRGRTLMPGLIDAHWHTIFAGIPVPALLSGDVRLHHARRRRRGRAHPHARLHHRPRPRRPLVRAQTGDRRRPRRRSPHLPVGRDDHAERWAWRSASPDRPAAHVGRPALRNRADGRREHRRRRRRGAAARARADHAGRLAGQAHRQRRRVVAADDCRHGHVHRARSPRRGRDRGRSADLRRRSRLPVGRGPAGRGGRRPVHRARASHGRGDGAAHGRKGRSGSARSRS